MGFKKKLLTALAEVYNHLNLYQLIYKFDKQVKIFLLKYKFE